MKKLISLLVAAVMALSLATACQLTDDTNQNGDPAATPTAQPAGDDTLDLTAIAAKIGGEETITLGDVKTVFDMYVEYFSYYGYDVTSDTATLEGFQDDVVNMLVQEKLINYKARELGYAEFTTEQQAELDQRVEEEIDNLNEYYRAQAESEAQSDATVDVDARTMELILEEAISNLGDENATYEMYCEELSKNVESQYLAELVKEDKLKDVVASEDQISEEYNADLAEDTEAYGTTPENYKGDQEGFESSGEGVPVLFVPEGYHRVMDIYIPFEGTVPEECTTKKTEMNQLKTEYSELAFADAISASSANSARMKEIITQYQALSAEYDALYAEYTASTRKAMEDVYARLENGEDFKTVMAETTQNADFTEIDAFAQKGMLIAPTLACASDWSDTFKAYFAELSLGEYSQIFEDESGLRIIYYAADETPGAKELSQVHDEIAAYLESTLKDEEWNTLVDEWTKEEGTVTLFPEVYRVLGKSDDTAAQ